MQELRVIDVRRLFDAERVDYAYNAHVVDVLPSELVYLSDGTCVAEWPEPGRSARFSLQHVWLDDLVPRPLRDAAETETEAEVAKFIYDESPVTGEFAVLAVCESADQTTARLRAHAYYGGSLQPEISEVVAWRRDARVRYDSEETMWRSIHERANTESRRAGGFMDDHAGEWLGSTHKPATRPCLSRSEDVRLAWMSRPSAIHAMDADDYADLCSIRAEQLTEDERKEVTSAIPRDSLGRLNIGGTARVLRRQAERGAGTLRV